jgi:hypothetical protein
VSRKPEEVSHFDATGQMALLQDRSTGILRDSLADILHDRLTGILCDRLSLTSRDHALDIVHMFQRVPTPLSMNGLMC